MIPENYYLLKNKNFLSVEFDYNKYIEFDIYNFYAHDSIIFCILELLDFIKSKIYLSSSNLLKYIHIFPFKYVYLTKIKINSSILDKLNYKINKHFHVFKYFRNKTLEKNEEKISSVFHIEEEKDQNQFMDSLNLDYNDYEDEEEKYVFDQLILKLLEESQLKEVKPDINNKEIYLYRVFLYFQN